MAFMTSVSPWVATSAQTGTAPAEGSAYWVLLAQKGDTGPAGAAGAAGAQGVPGPTGPQGSQCLQGPPGTIASNSVTSSLLATDAASLAKITGGQLNLNGTMIDWRNSAGDLGKLGQSLGGGWLGLYNSSGTVNAYIGASDVTYFNGGNVGIGTSTPGYKLDVNGTAYRTGSWSGSDARWKKNVQPVTHALDKVTHLQGVTYDWRRDEFPDRSFDEGTQLGFLAQEVEKVVPEAVHTDAHGYKAVAYEKLAAVLAEGVKEQQTEIQSLKAENVALKKDVTELKALVHELLGK
jgi:hypothetical protein